MLHIFLLFYTIYGSYVVIEYPYTSSFLCTPLLLSYVPLYLTSFILLLLVFAIAMGIAVAKVIEMQKLNASNLRYVSCITTNYIHIFYIAHHSTSQHNLKNITLKTTRPFSSLIVFCFFCGVS